MEGDKKRGSCQVIDDDLNYAKKVSNFFKAEDMNKLKGEYNSVSVIGAQSSGKSTLLNLLFKTDFQMLDQESDGNQQTTKGIWVSADPSGKIIVFDIEGTDSAEREEQKATFEQCTSLFSLVISDVILVNMWATDVGRHAASNYEIFKVILECNLKLFNQSSKKKMLFVIRDFNEKKNNPEKTKDKLFEGLDKIWDAIYKPDKHKDSAMTDFFVFDFWFMPNKEYQEDEFVEMGGKLRDRFFKKPEEEDALFLPRDNNFDPPVPIDGLSIFYEQTWDVIRNQKELNLPDQREMVANFRCNEIKQEAFDLVKAAMDTLLKDCISKEVNDFGKQCEGLISKAVKYYEMEACQYKAAIFDKFKKEIVANMLSEMYKGFDMQLKMLRQKIEDHFEEEMEKICSRGDKLNNHFHQQTMELMSGIIGTFKKKSTTLLVDRESDWVDEIERYTQMLSNAGLRRIKEKRQEEMKKLHTMYNDAVKDTIKTDVSDAITRLNPGLWSDISESLKTEFEAIIEELHEILQSGFDCTLVERNDFIENFKVSVKKATNEYVVERVKNLNEDVLRKFKHQFERDDKGRVRDWIAMEVPAIRELWAQSFTQLENIFTEFRHIGINFDELVAINSTPSGDDKLGEQPQMMKRRSSSISGKDRLMSEVEINKCKDRFREEAEKVLEDALRLHSNVSSGGIPWWFLALFAWFAIDDIWRMAMSPFLFYPIMLVVSVAALLYSMGLGPLVIPQAQSMVNMYLRKLGMNLVL